MMSNTQAKGYLDEKVKNGELYHYMCRCECFPDIVRALNVLFNDNNIGRYDVIYPQIKSYIDGEAYLDFYSTSTIDKLVEVWEKYDDCDYHRVYQTLNYHDKYDGDVIR